MKHILSGVALAVALALSAPAWAQQSPSQAPPDQTSATPAKHRHARTVHHAARGRTVTRMHATAAGGNNVANRLNQQELSRLHTGSSMEPALPTMSGPGPGPASSSRMAGPKTSGSGYVPSEPGAGTMPPTAGPPAVGPGAGAPR
jgi:hypothetical protein